MYRMSFLFLLTGALILAGIPAGVQAQKKRPAPTPPQPQYGPLTGTYNFSVNAIELSQGQSASSSNETFGWSSYGNTQGDLNGFMFMSITLAPVDSSAGGVVSSNVDSQVVGGSWSKLIFVDGAYTGSVYGKIIDGSVTWVDSETAKIQLQLTSDDGTLAYAGQLGKGTFSGFVSRSGRQGTVSGSVELSY